MFIGWCYKDDVLTEEECKYLIDIARPGLTKAGILMNYGEEGDPSAVTAGDEIRQGSTYFFQKGQHPEADVILSKLVNAFGELVQWYWGYTLKSVAPIQLAFYKPGDYYEWHYDSPGSREQAEVPELRRDFSATIELTCPKTYEGGGLEFMPAGKPESKQGRMIAFPSFLLHRARKVLAGERIALVLWANSNLFTELKNDEPVDMQQTQDSSQTPQQVIKAKVLDQLP